MYRKLLKLNFRLIFTSLVFALVIAFALGFFMVYMVYTGMPGLKPINFSAVINGLSYLEVGLLVMVFCHAMYCAHQTCLLEEICFIPRSAVVMCKLAASIIATSTVCLIPCGFILFSAVKQGTELLFTVNTLCFTLIRWLLLLLTANTYGFFLGHFIKNVYAYIFAAPFAILSSYFNTPFIETFLGFRSFSSRIVSELFSVCDSHQATMEMDYPGSRVDLYYLLDALFLVLVSLVLMWLLNVIVSKRFSVKKVAVGIVLIGSVGLTVLAYVTLAPIEYRYEEKLYLASYEAQPYEITDYEGDFALSEFSQFSGSFIVRPIGTQTPETLTIKLDGCFTVDELTSKDGQVEFTRSGDYLTLEAPSEPTTFQIRYHGRVYYLSDQDCVNLFTSWLSAALPPNFAFVPLIDGDLSTKNYDIRVSCANTVVSNVDVTPEGKMYHLNGQASSLCIFSGFLTECELDGITVYRTKYNFVTDYNAVLQRAMSNGYYFDPYAYDPHTHEIKQGSFSKPDKAFLIYSLYDVLGFPIVYEDYILLNYGFTL